MGQNICEQAPLTNDIPAQSLKQHKIQQIPSNIQLQSQSIVISDQPHSLFAIRLQNTNFLLPAKVEERLIQLKSFIYPDGLDIAKGNTLLYRYLLKNGAIYAGDWKGGKMQGKGLFLLPDKSLLACCMKDNAIWKKARIIYPNGDYYEGEVSNNKAQGRGRLVQGKVTYTGEFKDNKPHGKGKQGGEGYSFEGQYEAGQKKNGTLTWQRDGQTLTYKGQFKNNLFQGRGIVVTKDGRYMGQFENGEKSGLGKFYYKNHRYYQGEFKKDRRDGEGKIIDEQRSQIVVRGVWREDILVE